MKKPPGLWFLLTAGALLFYIQEANGLKATALIFGKTSTTTSTEASETDSATNSTKDGVVAAEGISEPNGEGANVTKPALSGIPQQDYIYDLNLPRELQGYNLTEYPFYERVPPPDEIDFKCDGLHDGFYASVPHKCQVYHHCLFGTRYDFLCANYTAFDQKTFICHFVSEVDCVNSKKFWHRNDALYQEASTTTAKPLIIYRDRQPSEERRPVQIAGDTPRKRPRPPARRRRPQYEYYDDEYDEEYDEPRYTATEAPPPPPPRRKKPRRPRPRPVYEDEYYDDEYEDERYERRGGSRRDEERDRRPYRRPAKRPSDRRRPEDDYEDDARDDDERFDRTEDRKSKRPRPDTRRHEEKHEHNEGRKHTSEDDKEVKHRPADQDRYERPRSKGHRRPPAKEYEEEEESEDRKPPRKHQQDRHKDEQSSTTESKALIRPNSGSSVYDKPRAPPRIRPPVPKNEASKYSYKTSAVKSTPKPVEEELEYYDDEYEEPAPKKSTTTTTTTTTAAPAREEGRKHIATRKYGGGKSRPKSTTPKSEEIEEYEDEKEPVKYNPKVEDKKVGQASYRRPSYEEYDDVEDDLPEKPRHGGKHLEHLKSKDAGSSMTTTTVRTLPTAKTTTTEIVPTTRRDELPKAMLRIVKRPFLPSRGGNPYSARGLQPLGIKAVSTESDEVIDKSVEIQKTVETKQRNKEDKKPLVEPVPKYTQTEHKLITPEPVIYKTVTEPVVQKYKPIPVDVSAFRRPEEPVIPPKEEFVPVKVSTRPKYQSADYDFRPAVPNRGPIRQYEPKTTAKPKLVEKNPLDINENDYDVTLNDALNPTLPNLPVRSYPTGFSATDYTYNPYSQRPRYVVDASINQASSEYSYMFKEPQRYEPVRIHHQQFNGPVAGFQQMHQTFRQAQRINNPAKVQVFTAY